MTAGCEWIYIYSTSQLTSYFSCHSQAHVPAAVLYGCIENEIYSILITSGKTSRLAIGSRCFDIVNAFHSNENEAIQCSQSLSEKSTPQRKHKTEQQKNDYCRLACEGQSGVCGGTQHITYIRYWIQPKWANNSIDSPSYASAYTCMRVNYGFILFVVSAVTMHRHRSAYCLVNEWPEQAHESVIYMIELRFPLIRALTMYVFHFISAWMCRE